MMFKKYRSWQEAWHSSNLAHFVKDLLRSQFYSIKDFLSHDSEYMNKNKELMDKHLGERGFLLCTGQSLDHIDLLKIKDENTFGIGLIMLHNEIANLNLNYVIASEPYPVMDKPWYMKTGNWPEDLIPSGGKNSGYLFLLNTKKLLSEKGTVTFLNCDYLNYIKYTGLFTNDLKNVYFLKSMNSLHQGKILKSDLTKRHTGGGGSVFNSLLIMISMGFKEIYLAGAGYTYYPQYELHFYDKYKLSKPLTEIEIVSKSLEISRSHNIKRKSNIEFYDYYETQDFIIPIFVTKGKDFYRANHEIINEYAKKKGVKIFNITPDKFNSPIYEKISWEYVQNNVIGK